MHLKMKGQTFIYPDPKSLCSSLAAGITAQLQASARGREAYVAISGGSTPLCLFREMAALSGDKTFADTWSHVHFFWADERCVPPSHEESNYRSANEYLFSKLGIVREHIHRIRGEDEPASEAGRYSEQVKRRVPEINGLPSFDWILLGVGDDGHTASLFPDRPDLQRSERLVADTMHPQTHQRRITMTPELINNAARITFLVTGVSKQAILKKLGGHYHDADGQQDGPDIRQQTPAEQQQANLSCPASWILPVHGILEWWMDKEAASLIEHDHL